ncbi:MAG: T9SS type A sorting domain-containing protein [Phycisphaerae bacterium]|nr:T9SS type A sorting domain-containing protein [Saprospiraceae bacterium]
MKIFRFLLLTLSILLSRTNILPAQWVQTNCPTGGGINAFAVKETYLFAGTGGGGIFRSDDNGTSWTPVNSGLTNTDVSSLAVNGVYLFAGTSGGIFRSDDNGANWTSINSWIPLDVNSLAVMGTNLFAGTYHEGVFRSDDNGTNWASIGNGLPDTDPYNFNPYVTALVVSGTNLFAGLSVGGVCRLDYDGTYWTQLTGGDVEAFAVNGTSLFALMGSGVLRSDDNGENWTEINLGLTNSYTTSLVGNGAYLFAGTSDGSVLRSNDKGANWTAFNLGLPYSYIRSLIANGAYLFAGTYSDGVWKRPLSEIVSVENLSTDLPKAFSLSQNYPNPFPSATTITFSLPTKSFVSLKVFDALGKEVSVLVQEKLAAGTYVERWNAEGLPNGVYYLRLRAEGQKTTQTFKIIKHN